MSKKLSEIIKELEDKGAIRRCYMHHDYCFGELELNIEFNNDIADKILKDSGIETIAGCAYWGMNQRRCY